MHEYLDLSQFRWPYSQEIKQIRKYEHNKSKIESYKDPSSWYDLKNIGNSFDFFIKLLGITCQNNMIKDLIDSDVFKNMVKMLN